MSRIRHENTYRPNALLSAVHGIVAPIAALARFAVAAFRVITGLMVLVVVLLIASSVVQGLLRFAVGQAMELAGTALRAAGSLVGIG